MTRWLHLALDLCLVALSALVVWEVGEAVAGRFTYGYDLEWMEGGTLLSGLRAAEGRSLYGPPELDYIPFIYPPLYAWILGALGQVVPLGYGVGRAVSIVGSLAGAAALAFAARGAGARGSWAVAAGALFVGAYENGGTFYDLVRTDGLAIGLLGWSLALSARPGRRFAIAGGLLLAVAFAAKHHSAIFGLPVALVLWRRDGLRAGLTYGLAALVPALLFTIGMAATTEGRFLTWLLEVPATHGMVADRAVPWIEVESWWPWKAKSGGAAIEVWKALPIGCTAALLYPAWARRGPTGPYWLVVSLVALVTVSLMRGHTGGYVNVLIPGFWAAALWPVLAGVAVQARWAPAGLLVPVVLAGQLWQGRADLGRYVPTERDRDNAAALIEELRTLPGPMLIPHAPYYAVLAGHEPSFALICLWDIDHAGSPFKSGVRAIERAMKEHHWASVVVPDDKLGHGLQKHYRKSSPLKTRPVGTKTGWGVRLKQVWVPNRDATGPDATGPDAGGAGSAPDDPAVPEAPTEDPRASGDEF